MVYFKACPRCGGDMQVQDDVYGEYIECLQCGYVTYPQKGSSRWEEQPIPTRGRKKKVAA